MSPKSVPIFMTRDLYFPAILARTACSVHNAQVNEPCFTFPNIKFEGMSCIGVCNKRAKEAGMNGQIKPSSLVRQPLPKASYVR